MDVPVSMGVGVAFGASLWAVVSGRGQVYFDSVAMFVFFLLCGRYLEMLARQKAARGAEELGKVLPAVAERLPAWPDPSGERIEVSRLGVGDVIRVKAGEVIPADGEVIDGEGSSDESLLTGEAEPVWKGVGSAVTGGAVNGTAPLIVRVAAVGDSTRLAGVRRLMERAQSERPRIARLADRYAGRFVALVITAAILTGAYWWSEDPSSALWVCVSVLVVSCPCALSLATPVALTVATSAMARAGVLVTRGQAVETLAETDRFVFDKTGTLTQGKLRLERIEPVGGLDLASIRAIVMGLEQVSEHPIAGAVRAAGWPVHAAKLDDVAVHVGEGLSGRQGDRRYRLGRRHFAMALSGAQFEPVDLPSDDGRARTILLLASEGGAEAILEFSDELRADAHALVGALGEYGIATSILSGDTQSAVTDIGARLGVADAHGGLMPEDKFSWVEAMQASGERVAMVGDGVNDGPVLAKADVSIAMGEGAELARTQADVVLLGGRFAPLSRGLRIARSCRRVIRQNLLWALSYNLLAMPAAMAGYMTPWMAGIGTSASSLVVILNALRIQRMR